MNILVTGGAGFIGSHLVKTLLKQKHTLTVLDNFSSGKKEKLQPFLPKMTVITGDITDKKIVDKAVKNIDILFHLAAKVTVADSYKEKRLYEQVNISGTKILLEAALKNNVKKFIFASSAAVYGNQQSFPICEKTQTKPVSPLGKSKLDAEQLCIDARKKGLETIIFRFFNVFGPYQNLQYGNAVAAFIRNISQERQIIIFGGGMQTRDFIYIDDIVSACLAVLKKETKNEYIFNIASGKEYSINDLFMFIAKLMRKKTIPMYKHVKRGDIGRSAACICHANKYLTFAPSTSLIKGLKKTIPYFIKL